MRSGRALVRQATERKGRPSGKPCREVQETHREGQGLPAFSEDFSEDPRASEAGSSSRFSVLRGFGPGHSLARVPVMGAGSKDMSDIGLIIYLSINSILINDQLGG